MTDNNDFANKGVEVDQPVEPVFEQFAAENDTPELVIVEPENPEVPVAPQPEVIKGDQPAPEREFTLPEPNKPAWTLKTKHHRLGVGGHGFSVSTGPEVSYVNRRLGVAGDTFTHATRNAVAEWQRSNGQYVTGEVSRTEYNRL